MNQDQIEKHSTTQSVILHLLPGILVGCFYFLARQPVANMGYPSIFALYLHSPLFLFLSNSDICYIRERKRQAALHYRGSSAIEIQSRGGNTLYGQ